MPRSYKTTETYLKPDPRYGSKLASKIINKIMWQGKKTTAQAIFYEAVDSVCKKAENADPVDVFEVKEEDGDVLVASAGPREAVAQAIHEERAIRQARERVAESLAGQQLEPLGELVDLVRLLLDRGHHPVEGHHEGADLVVARTRCVAARTGRGDEVGRTRDGVREVPDHVATARHQESGKGHQGGDGERFGQALGGVFHPGHEVSVDHIGQNEERDDRAQSEGEDDLLLDPLSRKRGLPFDLNVHS